VEKLEDCFLLHCFELLVHINNNNNIAMSGSCLFCGVNLVDVKKSYGLFFLHYSDLHFAASRNACF
jgi:hypothetical protein